MLSVNFTKNVLFLPISLFFITLFSFSIFPLLLSFRFHGLRCSFVSIPSPLLLIATAACFQLSEFIIHALLLKVKPFFKNFSKIWNFLFCECCECWKNEVFVRRFLIFCAVFWSKKADFCDDFLCLSLNDKCCKKRLCTHNWCDKKRLFRKFLWVKITKKHTKNGVCF